VTWPVLWYTSFDTIRATLGVSAKESFLTDAQVGGAGAEDALHVALTSISGDLPQTYADIQDIEHNQRTPAQRQLSSRVRAFAPLCVARYVATALPMAARVISDGKASVSRFSDGPYRDALAALETAYHVARDNLAAAVELLEGRPVPAPSSPTLLVGARASVDRVTGQ
jgi:hypothetical protein